MKLKAKIEIEYNVDPEDYSFSESGDRKKKILKFERNVFIVAIDDLCADNDMCSSEPSVTVVEIE